MTETSSSIRPTWCPGCGNFGIFMNIKKALAELSLNPSSVFMTFGIGCSGNMSDFIHTYGMHGLHGRGIPNAIGMKLANHKIPVIVIGGDGDLYGEGGNHFLHACRGNHDITIIVHDNGVYGLTTGQVSPMAKQGSKSKSTPTGVIEIPLNPLSLAITEGATFISQISAFDNEGYLIIKKAILHKGISIVNILQPCVTFNKILTKAYLDEHSYKIENTYNKENFDEALKKTLEPNQIEKFPLGIIYEVSRLSYHENLTQLKENTLIEKSMFLKINELVKEFR